VQAPNPQSEPGMDEPDREAPQPPVPPDQRPDVVPQRDPPKPGRGEEPPPLIARTREASRAGASIHGRATDTALTAKEA
jgi:hypothetical protein